MKNKKAVKIGYVFEFKQPPIIKIPKNIDFFVNLHNHSEYCLSGDTVIYNCLLVREWKTHRIIRTDATNLSTCRTIKHLYDHTRKLNSPTWKYCVKVFDGKKFVSSKIKNIVKSKPKKLYRVVTESGKYIKASKFHKFLTIDGWRRLGCLKVGDLLACNGTFLYQDMLFFNNKEWLKYEKIISIKYCGIEETYDLEVEHGCHNFVANGIITHNSILDGISRIERGVLSLDLDQLFDEQVTLVRRAEQLYQPGVGLTDHGTLGGFFRFHTECVSHNINPIIGIEWYLVDNMAIRERGYSHVTNFAKNYNGLKNLFMLNKLAWVEGFYYKPRIDYSILKKYSKDTIMLSGCSGDSPFLKIELTDKTFREKNILLNDLTKYFIDIWGDDFYFEIMPHINYENSVILNKCVINLALKYGVSLVATNDSHYPVKEHSYAHEVMLCIQVNNKMHDPNHFKFGDGQLYLKSREETRDNFISAHSYIPTEIVDDALDNTVIISSKVHMEIPKKSSDDILPRPVLPVSYPDVDQYMDHLLKRGWKLRNIEGQLRKYSEKFNISVEEAELKYRKQLKHELRIIKKLGFTNYFLIVHELIDYCREQDITVGPGRGSAAGSLVCYLLRITSLDPMMYQLMFERFISIHKVTYPDIDLDFDWRKRDKIFEWMEKRFGVDGFAHIGTYSILKGKAVIRDIARVFDVPLDDVSIMAKNIVQRSGGDERKSMSVEDSFKNFEIMQKYDKQYPFIRINANILEGTTRNCIVGSTKITTNRITQLSNGSFERTIKHLYKTYKNFGKLPKVRLYNGDFFTYKKVKDIWYSGIKDVYKVICGNKKIICTNGEKFLTKNGYIELKYLNIGNYVARNGNEFISKSPSFVRVKWVKIDDIKYIGKRKTYDLEIDTNNEIEKNYLANGFVVHNSGVHACGVIVSDYNLSTIVPIETRGSKGAKRIVTSSVTGKENEKLGLLKLDILGLKTLSIIKDASDMIKRDYDIDIDIEKINLEDKDVLEEYTNLNYVGIFQFDSIGLRNTVRGYKFNEFEDVTVWNSLYRPGTMRSGITSKYKEIRTGKAKVKKVHPIYDKITEQTSGLIIYQEQVSKCFAEMAGFDLSDADQIRVAIAKSYGSDVLGKYRDGFTEGCVKVGVDVKIANKLFDQIIFFGCLSGDTIIHKSSSNQYSGKEITIKDLYIKNSVDNEYGKINKLLSLFENNSVIMLNDIVDVYYSGKKSLYLVETDSGKFGKMTMEHELKMINGYEQLKNVKIGDEILVTDFKKFANGYEVFVDKIKSIDYIGIENTYDIAMKIPYNNFVINNGMIVHNSYSFNKAHAAAYGMISYCCMWLKHYYPLQFLSASLSQEVDDMKVRELIKECTRLGITVDYPDINKSSVKFKADVKTNRILCGFSDIKGIGEKASAEIILNQPYIDIFDFLNKIKRRTVNIRVIKALVLSGSFDRWYKNRKYLFDNLDEIVNVKGKQQSVMASKIDDESETYIDFNSEEKMRMVRSVLSIPTTQHPTIYYKDIVKEKFGHLKFEKIGEIQHDVDQHHKYAYGIIIDMKYNQIGDFDKGKVTEEELYQRKLKLAPQGSRYVNFDLEDSSGFHRFNINPILYVRTRSIYESGIDTCCLVKYRVVKGVENMCYVEEIVSLDDVRNGKTDDISFRILNDHPIAKINFKKAKKFNILDIRSAKNKKVSIIICLVTDLKFYKIKTGIMAFVKLDDNKSFMDCVIWPDVIDKRTRKLLVRAFKLRKVMIIKVEKSVSVNKKQESKITFFIKKVIREYVSKK